MCVFCSIVDGKTTASLIHQDEKCLAFMNIRPINEGEFMVIPRDHIDHFLDLPDELATHIVMVAQRFGRKLQREFKPLRVGYVVHGFGVPHAHLNVVPMHDPSDIISAKHIVCDGGSFIISEANISPPQRDELEAAAKRLAE